MSKQTELHIIQPKRDRLKELEAEMSKLQERMDTLYIDVSALLKEARKLNRLLNGNPRHRHRSNAL
jgi:predicted nuclease with TOPRIM domain